MKTEKIIGFLLIADAIGVLVPYTLLTISFEYPDVLRKDPSVILTRFHEGGSTLILTWLAFAVMGLPLLIAYVMIGQQLQNKSIHVKWATTLGIISGVVQIIGFQLNNDRLMLAIIPGSPDNGANMAIFPAILI